ncbi:hypothetical protein ACM9HF_17650 [Colwellia sp. RE-S-Sl-9]
MKIKILTGMLSALILNNSAFADNCQFNGTDKLYVQEIRTGSSQSNHLNPALSITVSPVNDLTQRHNLNAHSNGYDLDDTVGRVFVTQLQMAMINGSIVTIANYHGNCSTQGFTGVYVFK